MIITTWIVYIFTRKSVGLPFPPKANSVSGGGGHVELGHSIFSPSAVLVCLTDTSPHVTLDSSSGDGWVSKVSEVIILKLICSRTLKLWKVKLYP